MSETRREDDKEEASPEPDELPPEIIEEILIRLPAKSIGRFRKTETANVPNLFDLHHMLMKDANMH
ncbi:hypothetical protein YC2023_063130 [Brassica napus]